MFISRPEGQEDSEGENFREKTQSMQVPEATQMVFWAWGAPSFSNRVPKKSANYINQIYGGSVGETRPFKSLDNTGDLDWADFQSLKQCINSRLQDIAFPCPNLPLPTRTEDFQIFRKLLT